jgi:3-deoxy-D-manno-octulosonic-acid transferase
MRLFYSLFIRLYTLLIALFATINEKAKLWIIGRKAWELKLKEIDFKRHEVFWFHCASLGEFEQGRPLIEEIKAIGKHKVLLTFFSPSGYELRKNYAEADWVFYLPADTLNNAQFFIDTVEPKAVFFIKYEFWFNYLYVLRLKSIPVFLVSGIFRENQYFFKWYGAWAAKQLSAFSYFFVQNQKSLELLISLGYKNAFVAGDTRFDRVVQIKEQRKSFDHIDNFVKHAHVCVAGSTYLEDEKILHYTLKQGLDAGINMKLMIAPHVVSSERINEIERIFGKEECIRFSELKNNEQIKNVLIIDNIGMLSSLYAYAHTAYIGGGLGKGIHNTLEAAVYSIPIVFGANYQKFDEAKALVNEGAAFVVRNEKELFQSMNKLFSDETLIKTMGAKSGAYVAEQQGAISIIMKELKHKKIIN